jgi:predicted dehydrogenase
VHNKEILLIGAGPMAVEYAKVIKNLSLCPIVIGRGEESAKTFTEKTGLVVISGGIEKYFQEHSKVPNYAIVCPSEKQLGLCSLQLLENGISNLLVEKPGGFDFQEIMDVADLANRNRANVYIGYNRRFYASVSKAKDIIAEDGGVQSFNFEFTEWGHVIANIKKEEGVKENWFIHNSTHVIDLAFYLCGEPKEMCCYTKGKLAWHPFGSTFGGVGLTHHDILFTYSANWAAPGRWGLEILTKKSRLIFRPLEKLQIQRLGSVAIEFLEIDDEKDTSFKPGLFKQVDSFINNKEGLMKLADQLNRLDIYKKMIGLIS